MQACNQICECISNFCYYVFFNIAPKLPCANHEEGANISDYKLFKWLDIFSKKEFAISVCLKLFTIQRWFWLITCVRILVLRPSAWLCFRSRCRFDVNCEKLSPSPSVQLLPHFALYDLNSRLTDLGLRRESSKNIPTVAAKERKNVYPGFVFWLSCLHDWDCFGV